jgi:hypothetical protein
MNHLPSSHQAVGTDVSFVGESSGTQRSAECYTNTWPPIRDHHWIPSEHTDVGSTVQLEGEQQKLNRRPTDYKKYHKGQLTQMPTLTVCDRRRDKEATGGIITGLTKG